MRSFERDWQASVDFLTGKRSRKRKNPMGEWWRRMMQKVKPSAKVYSKASRRANKVKP